MPELSTKSLERLVGVHPDLQRVVNAAIKITDVDFGVTEGLRSKERQKELYDAGASKTMNSRHLTGHAVDLVAYVGGKVSWDWPLYHQIARAMKTAAFSENVPIEWGGDWRSFKDGPHFQLPWRLYPIEKPAEQMPPDVEPPSIVAPESVKPKRRWFSWLKDWTREI